jgi:hypothetical protein
MILVWSPMAYFRFVELLMRWSQMVEASRMFLADCLAGHPALEWAHMGEKQFD